MKRLLKISLITFLLFAGQSAYSDASRLNVVEHQVLKSNLIAFSSQAVKFKDCDDCPEKTLKVSAETTFFNRNIAVTLAQATELYLRNPYDIISIFVNRSEGKANSIVFGGLLERAEPADNN